jgi:hypothetical protein
VRRPRPPSMVGGGQASVVAGRLLPGIALCERCLGYGGGGGLQRALGPLS